MRVLILFFITLNFTLNAQLYFQFTWGNEQIENNKKYQLSDGDWIEFNELKLYLSNYRLGGKHHELSLNAVDLLDNEFPESKIILDSLNLNLYETLHFNFGLDSTINTSGILNGDLDPMNGMYWAWNSGYIHFKMTGKSSLISTPKKEFEFHLGGYRKPNQTYFSVELPIMGSKLQLDLKSLFAEHIKIQQESVIMIPSPNAKKICEAASKLFSIK